MKRVTRSFRLLAPPIAIAIACSVAFGCGGGTSITQLPQTSNLANTPDGVPITNAMLANRSSFSDFRYHMTPVLPPGTLSKPLGVVFPLDMTKGSGKVLTATTQNDIFVNTTSAAVGTPTTFQSNYNLSTFISVLNQYDGVTSAGKFPVGTSFTASVATFTNMISQDDLFNVIHAAAKLGGTGYGHQYHVFLAKGLDTCFDFGPCYAPDIGPPTFVFCAYHGSLTYTDIGHVIYSIMPYQDVAGCGDFGLSGLPNVSPIDSTATTLSHETAESISDPDPNTGWFNSTFGMEIGDVCNSLRALETLNGHKYVIQPEYSNSAHGCFF